MISDVKLSRVSVWCPIYYLCEVEYSRVRRLCYNILRHIDELFGIQEGTTRI